MRFSILIYFQDLDPMTSSIEYRCTTAGFGVPSDVGNFRASNRTNIEASSKISRLSSYMTFSSAPSSCSRFMPPITENGNDNVGTSSQQNGHLGSGQNGQQPSGCYLPNSHSDSTSNNFKRNRDSEVKMFSNLNGFDSQNRDSKHYSSYLVHQLSLPNTFTEMPQLRIFGSFNKTPTPCKIRAKRGFATHP